MRSFGENAEAAGAETDYHLEPGNDDRSQNGTTGGRALLGAHQLGRRNGGVPRHAGIIAAEREKCQANRGFDSGGAGMETDFPAHPGGTEEADRRRRTAACARIWVLAFFYF